MCARKFACVAKLKRGVELSTDHHLMVCELDEVENGPKTAEGRRWSSGSYYGEKASEPTDTSSSRTALGNGMRNFCPSMSTGGRMGRLFKKVVTSCAEAFCGVRRLGVTTGVTAHRGGTPRERGWPLREGSLQGVAASYG